MRLTTVRVRPGRSEKLRELGVEFDRKARYVEVMVFGETIAVACVDEDNNAGITWMKEGFSEGNLETFLEMYFRVVEDGTRIGLVPA